MDSISFYVGDRKHLTQKGYLRITRALNNDIYQVRFNHEDRQMLSDMGLTFQKTGNRLVITQPLKQLIQRINICRGEGVLLPIERIN